MFKTRFAFAVAAATFWGHAALAQTAPAQTATTPAPAASAAPMSTAATPIGDLRSNPASKAVVDKNLPGFSENPRVKMALDMTLKGVQPYADGKITDENLAAIDADLAKLPAKK